MEELNKAIKQLKCSLNNIDKAEEKLFCTNQLKEADLAEHLSLEIAKIIDFTYDLKCRCK